MTQLPFDHDSRLSGPAPPDTAPGGRNMVPAGGTGRPALDGVGGRVLRRTGRSDTPRNVIDIQ